MNKHEKTMLDGTTYKGERNVCCPECGFGYSHIREVLTRVGSDQYQAVTLVFEGECEHVWYLEFKQHKGVTFIRSGQHEPAEAVECSADSHIENLESQLVEFLKG